MPELINTDNATLVKALRTIAELTLDEAGIINCVLEEAAQRIELQAEIIDGMVNEHTTH